MASDPDPRAEWWTTSDVAAYLGVGVATVSAYHRRGQMPPPDKTIGRTHVWRPSRIMEWHRSRPRPGVGGRPARSKERERTDIQGQETSAERAWTVSGDTRWVVHGRRPIYRSEWVRLDKADVELPDGQRFEHHVLWMPAAAITALLNDAGTHVLLLWRHRFVPDLWNWELPGGIVDDGEDPAETAAREVVEETGYRARSLTHVVTFEPMIGMATCPHHVFVGKGAEHVGGPTEKTEMQRMEWVPLTDIPDLITSGAIRSSGALVALLHVLAINRSNAAGHSPSAS